jgi:dolichol kinase
MTELAAEARRKLFHQLCLAYLAAYWLLGGSRVLPWLLAWAAFVLAFELARLRFAGLNAALWRAFGGIARPEEARRVSGIFYTSLGALGVVFFFGGFPKIVAAALLDLALGDAAAALAGRALGRHKLLGGRKSFEGSLACFLVCALVGFATGYGAAALTLSALAATALELAPYDNLFMPVGAALALRLLT